MLQRKSMSENAEKLSTLLKRYPHKEIATPLRGEHDPLTRNRDCRTRESQLSLKSNRVFTYCAMLERESLSEETDEFSPPSFLSWFDLI